MSAICFPLPYSCTKFPTFLSKEGSFGAVRQHDVHTGVDLYTIENAPVIAIQSGLVASIEAFTGPEADSSWWLPTGVVLVEGEAGVIAYGEVSPKVEVGETVLAGQILANVIPVLPFEKERRDIRGHSRFMLHVEVYEPGTRTTVWWKKDQPQPSGLKDPTPLLTRAFNERSISMSDPNQREALLAGLTPEERVFAAALLDRGVLTCAALQYWITTLSKQQFASLLRGAYNDTSLLDKAKNEH